MNAEQRQPESERSVYSIESEETYMLTHMLKQTVREKIQRVGKERRVERKRSETQIDRNSIDIHGDDGNKTR